MRIIFPKNTPLPTCGVFLIFSIVVNNLNFGLPHAGHLGVKESLMQRLVACLATLGILVGPAYAGHDCRPNPCPEHQVIQKTVMVPEWTTEKRMVNVTECRPEERQRTCTVYKQVREVKQVEREYTVMVPEQRTHTVSYTVCKPVWETQTCEYTVMVPQQKTRTETYTVCKPVWETRTCEYTVMVPQQKTRTETYTVCKPVWETKTCEYTVMVPHCEKRQGTRTVCKMVPVTEKRTVCEDQGHWEEVAYTGECHVRHCGGCCSRCHRCVNECGGCGGTCRKWVSNVVKKEVEVTCMRPKQMEETYEYEVTVCKPEKRTREVKVCKYVHEQKTRECTYTVCVPEKRTRELKVCKYVHEQKTRECTYTVCVPEKRTKEVKVCRYVHEEKTRPCTYTVCVPKKMTKTCNVVSYKCVPEQKVEKYTVMVPHTVQKEVEVRVCKMVPKTVECLVPVHCCDRCHRMRRCCW
jgi:hypothetical protein